MPDLFGLARPLLHSLDAETAHTLGVRALSLLPRRHPPGDDPRLAVAIFGVRFPNPVGMAAGFDKHAEAIDGVLALGAGFTEIGGVTPQPQPGNPRPRVFRLPEDRAVINRYGLNSVGMAVVAQRLAARRARSGVVGVNLGANKDSADRTGDYAQLAARLAPLADFLTINVSSPNTPGLRDLQGEAALDELVARTLDARDGACHGVRRAAILIKIAPDLDEAGLDAILAVALRRGVDGLVVANTTVARPASLKSHCRAETGGLSGKPLFEPSTRLLAQAAVRLEGKLPLVGVGGVDDGATALAKIEAGASLVQLYSAMIYKGPGLFAAIKRDLTAHLDKVGAARLSDLTGRRAAAIAAGEPIL